MSKKNVGTRTAFPKGSKKKIATVHKQVARPEVAEQLLPKEPAEHATREEKWPLAEALQRLRESKQNVNRRKQGELFREGYQLGRRWAMNRPETDGLERLEALRANCDSEDEWHGQFKTPPNATHGACAGLAMILHPEWEEAGDWNLARNWWREIGDEEKAYQPAYLCGFAEGALAVWRSLEDQL